MFDYSRLIDSIEQNGGFGCVAKRAGIAPSVLSLTVCKGKAFNLSHIHQLVGVLPINHSDVGNYFFTLKV